MLVHLYVFRMDPGVGLGTVYLDFNTPSPDGRVYQFRTGRVVPAFIPSSPQLARMLPCAGWGSLSKTPSSRWSARTLTWDTQRFLGRRELRWHRMGRG